MTKRNRRARCIVPLQITYRTLFIMGRHKICPYSYLTTLSFFFFFFFFFLNYTLYAPRSTLYAIFAIRSLFRLVFISLLNTIHYSLTTNLIFFVFVFLDFIISINYFFFFFFFFGFRLASLFAFLSCLLLLCFR